VVAGAVDAQGEPVGVRAFELWTFNESPPATEPPTPHWQPAEDESGTPLPKLISGQLVKISGISVGKTEDLWVSSPDTDAGLVRIVWETPAPLEKDMSRPYSPAAIDEEGNVYVVKALPVLQGGNFLLEKYPPDATNNSDAIPASDVITAAAGAPVGSPLLGQPSPIYDEDGEIHDEYPAEIYVVTKNGTVYAFDMNLNLLWELETNIGISPAAQPLLVGNTLWIVGTQGQVRAVRVNSNGLNQKALWPKHLKDNCNTGNAKSSAAELPACF
jgi:hypothetical protein